MGREGWNRRYETAELVWTAEPNQFLVAEVASLPPGTVLDLGAGEGRNAVWLAQQGWRVTAVDFSDVGLAKADQLAAAARVEVTTVCADVADHTPPPGGTLLVFGHDATNLTDGYGGPQDPDVLFSPDDVVADLAGSGLVVEKAERVHRSVETPEGEQLAIDALVRAQRVRER